MIPKNKPSPELLQQIEETKMQRIDDERQAQRDALAGEFEYESMTPRQREIADELARMNSEDEIAGIVQNVRDRSAAESFDDGTDDDESAEAVDEREIIDPGQMSDEDIAKRSERSPRYAAAHALSEKMMADRVSQREQFEAYDAELEPQRKLQWEAKQKLIDEACEHAARNRAKWRQK